MHYVKNCKLLPKDHRKVRIRMSYELQKRYWKKYELFAHSAIYRQECIMQFFLYIFMYILYR